MTSNFDIFRVYILKKRRSSTLKKRFLSLICALLFSVMGVFSGKINVRAAEPQGEDVPFSYLLTEDAMIGYAERMTRGVYLLQGYSVINDAGGGKIGCGGTTDAAKRCTVTVNAVVERKTSAGWERVTGWTKTNTNALTASVSKYLSVTSGYYYRVRSIHGAGSDSSSSWTSGLWM